ncbi:IS110 family transposase [Paenibacillus eucommiae]|uniref:Transposase n=1 Tax=Paenibacillus eucommiae TaxID=1355755 RepID=A0ABS4J193_9BACL|nr:IS110 family transposase [Paenibacillus eucommiae]MBP1993603.1 transposase [Paenibacillus eucommiae]
MKFKQKDKENQRIENISTTHLVVGIDIAKENHVARATNYRGKVLGKPCFFTNDLDGCNKLKAWICALLKGNGFQSVILGMEPTGHYWLNLANWCMEEWQVVLVNPAHVKGAKENRDNSPTKSDVKDALVIADQVRNGFYSELRLREGVYQELHVFMGIYECVNKQFVSIQNRIHRWLDMWFPEYRHVFKKWTCKTSLATLQLFTLPGEVKNMTAEAIYEGWKPLMQRRGSKQFAHELVEQAKRSIGRKEGAMAAKWEIDLLMRQYLHCEKEMADLMEQVTDLLTLIPMARRMLEMKGIGPVMTATLLAETGDLSGYVHGRQILRRAGLHLCEHSSGKHSGQVKLTKRGSAALRKIMYMTVISLVSNNEGFKRLHEDNVENKKMKRNQSIIKLCGKYARILVGMARAGDAAYDPEKVADGSKAA